MQTLSTATRATATRADHSPTESVVPRDLGTSLIEVLVAIVLMGTVIAAIVGALLTSVNASSTAFASSELETVLLNARDRVQRAGPRCDYDDYVEALAVSEGWAPDAITADVQLLVRDVDGTNPRFESVPGCTSVEPGDVQKVTINATHPTRNLTRTLQVVTSSVK